MIDKTYIVAPSYGVYLNFLMLKGLTSKHFKYLQPDYNRMHSLRDFQCIVLLPSSLGNWSVSHIKFLYSRSPYFLSEEEFH